MGPMKNTGHLLPSPTSDEDGKKASKGADWPVNAVAVLVDDYAHKFSAGRGHLRGKDWEELMMKVNEECNAAKLSKTVKQCKDKVDSLKRRYKMEKLKAVKGSDITWPFFTKLDDMMGSVLKHSRDLDLDGGHHRGHLYHSNGDQEREDDDDYTQDFAGFPGESYGLVHRKHNTPHHMSFLHKGKGKAIERDVSYEDGYPSQRQRTPLNFLSLRGPQLSTDNSNASEQNGYSPLPNAHSPVRQSGGATARAQSRKRKWKHEHRPMRVLADGITGFSEVYARVELAKLEILATLKQELAKLKRKQRKVSSRRERVSSSSTCSG